MTTTKVIVVTHYEHIGTTTDGADLSKKIELALAEFPSNVWEVRSATTTAHTAPNPGDDFRADTTYTTTMILDKVG